MPGPRQRFPWPKGAAARNHEIGKGYELSKTHVILVTDEELRQMPLPTAKAIEIEGFVPSASIDQLKVGEGYYLQPNGAVAGKPYCAWRSS